MMDSRIIIYVLITILLFSSCVNKRNIELEGKLTPVQIININKLNKYISKNAKDDLYYKDTINNLYKKIEWADDFDDNFILADLDEDGIYEIYWRNIPPTGILIANLYGYNPKTEKLYYLNSGLIKGHTMFKLFIYKNELYFIEYGGYRIDLINGTTLERMTIKILYKPILRDDEIIIENVQENIYNEIVETKILDKFGW
jgi:hypothetical protein